MPELPVVCEKCKKTYKLIAVLRPVKLGEHIAGYCPPCAEALDMRVFGGVREMVEALR